MSSEQLDKIKPFWRPGTTQANRWLPELDPSHVRLMDLTPEDWLLFARNFSSYIPFFSTQFPDQVIGDWGRFFGSLLPSDTLPDRRTEAYRVLVDELATKIRIFETTGELSPHMGLFCAFLKLMRWPTDSMNQLTKRHLDFYYKRILHLKKKSFSSDHAFLTLELAKIPQVHLPEGTLFDGGKDTLGKRRVYRTLQGFTANQAKIGTLRNRYIDHTLKKVFQGQNANSLDGKGKPFSDGFPRWWPFGNPGLDVARFGITLADANFLSPTGTMRHFSIEFTFRNPLSPVLTPAELTHSISADWTCEKEWVQVNPVQLAAGFASRCQGRTLQLAFTMEEILPGIAKADPKIHEEVEIVGIPLVRLGFKASNPRIVDFLLRLAENPCQSITVRSIVQGIRLPKIESDMGVLQATKPFMPFSSYPKQGSGFYIHEPTWEGKNVTRVSVDISWANTPKNFREQYFGYRNLTSQNFSKVSYVAQHFVAKHTSIGNIKNVLLTPLALNKALQESKVQVNVAPSNLIVEDDSYFTYDLYTRDNVNWNKVEPGRRVLFSKEGETYKTKLTLGSTSKLEINQGIRLSLNQSFLHELFPRFYAMAMASEHPETLIPNEPYTPLAEQISLSYETSETYQLNQPNRLKLFLSDDFGYYEENISRKQHLPTTSQQVFVTSFPRQVSGELMIQILDLVPGQLISLLFQVLDGSENPLNSRFTTQNGIRWEVLIKNHWVRLGNQQIIADGTDNLLRSGILRLQIPDAAFEENTRMGGPGVWIRAVSTSPFDSTCQLMDVLPQAFEVAFENDENGLDHLNQGLPAKTISKMVERVAGVKSVLQPFNSFSGRPEESDRSFYTRISERLRHKNRAVSLWDYEHLVLEAFPDVYKVKCLNHVSPGGFFSPGHVTLLVIPDTVDKNVYDRFKPRFSTGRLNEIHAYLVDKISPSLTLHVESPNYEEIHVRLGVKFRKGFDPAHHRNLLEQAIIGYLSPWAIERRNSIEFGVSLHESPFIHFLESIPYVAYISDLVLLKNNISVRKAVMATSPRHILVSSKSHSITLLT
ncbi:baseplate J/gp47 family protein [Lunatimonas lonarensis]|nr:baseplate J/gp47 family protein [Lunatimonas lonarensis]